ncbi:MAG: hypothetical protein V2I45_04400, partial [Halieaceae bacterium]|nr:hypothetical protein [Halieaceae bacterium]
MKHINKLISCALLVMCSPACFAQMYLNEQGRGEALLFPFYSAQNGNTTTVSISNTTSDAKAVSISIHEAKNGMQVLDFNAYLAPNDSFDFVIAPTTGGGAEIRTVDDTCTVPRIPDRGPYRAQPFFSRLYSNDDDTSIGRTEVGSITIIEMGQIAPNYSLGSIFLDVVQGAQGISSSCDDLVG